MAKQNPNVYSRCTCCDQVLGANQPLVRATGKVDDLCSECRYVVNKAIHYHEEDVVELEHDVWGYKMGSDTYDRTGGLTPPKPDMDGQ